MQYTCRKDDVSLFSQLVKGVLEGCVLAIIAEEETYGYEIMEKLAARGFHFAKEGSIYPLLLRLEREKLVESTLRPSPSGPNRKYYRLSEEGASQLAQFRSGWQELAQAVDAILHQKG
ncbi:PadR family transcriptional regulator [Paenibacillus sp. S-38]|uniref:PadR family transcriptional regulator n=1 Tax=Paenibacillus sp. S-38 TaxID=3416710 RepID=UPI003CFA1A36